MHLPAALRRAPTIRHWLILLLAAFVVPTAVAVLTLFLFSYERERAGVEQASLDVARALMQTIDREMASAQGTLQALATSPNLDRGHGDIRAFYLQAADMLRDRPGNILLLADSDGRQIMNTYLPFGARLPPHGNPGQLRAVLRSGLPAVSDLYLSPSVGRLLTSVDVPVPRSGPVRYVLSLQYVGDRMGAIMQRQNVPAQAAATIYDGAARVVWRSHGAPGDVGTRAGAALAAALARRPEGAVEELGADGVRYVTLFSRSSLSNWAVAIALRRADLTAALWRSLAWITGGALGLCLLGVLLVRAIGARIARSIVGLVAPASALGRGEPVTVPPLHVREAKALGDALVKAAALLRQRTAERDAAFDAERGLRDAHRATERSEAFLRGIFEETPDGVLLMDAACRVTAANAQAETLFGYAQGALAGVAVETLLVDTPVDTAARVNRGTVCERIQAAPSRAYIDGHENGHHDDSLGQLHGLRRDGARFPADAMASPLRERGLVILTVRDITHAWQTEEALRRALDDKGMLLKELHHRVKNNLQLIVSLFNLQVRALDDDDGRHALLDAAGRVRAMALVHERLYQASTLSPIALDSYIRDLCEQLARASSAAQRGIGLRIDVAAAVEVALDVAVPLGLLINELVSNSLKHGFPDGRAGMIRVRLACDHNGALVLTVSDDGVGFVPNDGGTSGQSLGLKLVSALSEQMHASFTLDNHGTLSGTVATLVFQANAASTPAPPAAARPV